MKKAASLCFSASGKMLRRTVSAIKALMLRENPDIFHIGQHFSAVPPKQGFPEDLDRIRERKTGAAGTGN